MRRTLPLLVAGALALLAGGCSDDDGDDDDAGATEGSSVSTGGDDGADISADAQPYVDAMIESFDESDPEDLQIDREQAECLAPRWVEIMQPARLAAAGIEPEDFSGDGEVDLSTAGLSEDDGNAMYDSMADCDIDFRELIVDTMASGGDLSEEDAECLRDAFDDDLLRRLAITALVEGEEALDEDEELADDLVDVLSQCSGAIDDD